MGFYGNITNTNKTQFTFDRTYPNRKTMEARLATDEIYLGRYVLIEYDMNNNNTLDTYLKCYVKKNNRNEEEFYTSPNFEADTRIRWSQPNNEADSYPTPSVQGTVTSGQLVYVEKDTTPDDKNSTLSTVFYQCTNIKEITANGEFATFRAIAPSETPYTSNYNIDTAMYGAGRGYDSTVWQKVYSQNTEKYVMIAELNSVVPTFDLAVDAPTMTPITPHFDEYSTNVYYKLHWQPQWGLRVARQGSGMNSDETAFWTSSTYDPITDKMTTTNIPDVPAAINYNKPAFEPYQTTYKHDNSDNYFTILPTGVSGQLYNAHNGTGEYIQQVDIQEMRINLPAIGNMVSDAWDIIHGPNRDDARTDENGSLQGRLNSFKDIGGNQIPVKRSNDGTLVGTNINGNTPRTVTDITTEVLHTDDKTQDDAWIKTIIDTNGLTDAKNVNNNGISIHHTFTSTPDTTSTSNKNIDAVNSTNASDKIELYTPHVDAAGHVVGKNIETVTLPYGYKSIQTNGRGADTSTANDGEMTDQATIVANSTQDTLTVDSGNKWIRIDTDADDEKITISHDVHAIDVAANGHTNLNKEEGAAEEKNLTIYDWEYDNAGHITAKKEHTYTLPFGFKTIEVANSDDASAPVTNATTNIVADATQDTLNIAASNKWIKLDTNTEDTVKLGHLLSAQTPITVGNETLSPKFGESFKIPRFTTDEAGHITVASDQTITLQAGSYTPANSVSESTEVITSIGFDAATGDITSTKADSSTLKLASYSAGTATDDVANGDTYNSAFAKLQNQINGLDYSENSTTKIITAINQTDGLISVTRGDAGTLLLTGYELKESEGSDADLLATDNLKTAFSKLQRQIHVEEAARAAAIDALDAEITTEDYEVISSISEVDGKISAEKKKAGTLTLSDYSKPSSGSAISPSDTLNAALGKLEYKLDAEIKRVDDLDYTDPNTNTTQIITKVTQTDGKIEVVRSNAGTLLLTGYSVGTNGEKIASTDSINAAFAKLQTQINNVIGSEEIATNFDNIKKISDWLSANDSNADKVIDDIATLKGDASVANSVQNQIKTAIEGLDSEKTATAGNYISGIHIVDGKIDSIDETALPEISWNDVTDKPTDLVTSNQIVNMVEDTDIEGMVTESSPFTYPAITDSTGAEISPADAAMTIALLFKKVAALEARIYALENPVTNETPEPTPEEGGEETPTE